MTTMPAPGDTRRRGLPATAIQQPGHEG